MSEIIFIEGVSGVGKSTTVGKLSQELNSMGYNVKSYVEFDYTNPIDFYCTAYLSVSEYEKLCERYSAYSELIVQNTVKAGSVRLVRYYNEDIPLFKEPLLSELRSKEFCYNPKKPVSFNQYSTAYKNVWENFVSDMDEKYDFIIFDGSLLHHPINDMMRNYDISEEAIKQHIDILLNALGNTKRRIFYIKTDNIGRQLERAYTCRNQSLPTEQQIEFWENRYKNDMLVLENIQEDIHIFNVSDGKWQSAREKIRNILIS